MGCCISTEERKLLQANLKNTHKHSFAGVISKCVILDCYDGDTCTIAIFTQKNQIESFKCRLEGIDTPEIKGIHQKSAFEARNYFLYLATNKHFTGDNKKEIQDHLSKHKRILTVHCGGWDKYGRLLVTLYNSDNFNINKELIAKGYAKSYDGGKKDQ